jgi:hypothetical protein
MPEPPDFERWTRMRPYQVDRLCATNNCAGVMVWNGAPVANTPIEYKHRCDSCGRVEWFNQQYPRIEHQPVVIPSPPDA